MVEFIEIVVTIVVALLPGPLVSLLLKLAVPTARPDNITEEVWNALQPSEIEEAGKWLGALERLISAVAVWVNEYVLLAGWLAFKVASKWEVWSNVLRVPPSFPNQSDLDSLRTRRIWGARMMMRFLLGTLANVLLGVVAAYVGQRTWEIVGYFCNH
jgi:hypothetical protein